MRSLAFVADDKLVTAGGGDCAVRLWNILRSSSEAVLGRMDGKHHTKPVHEVRVCVQHPSLLGSAGMDAYVKLWDMRAKDVAMTMAVESPAQALAFSCEVGPSSTSSHSGNRRASALVAVGQRNGSVSLWDLRSGRRLSTRRELHAKECRSVDFSPDGHWLLSGSFDGCIALCALGNRGSSSNSSAQSRRCLQLANTFRFHSDKVLTVRWDPATPSIFASTSADKTVCLWRDLSSTL